ncbi:vanadium-dependent haloperoxidase [Sphingosinicella terrae]|uniref:vanadium-dependent haloperoxidase n=1 Tax=Sphingosinicella terrae TaxID=2172047 RepID=UPI000E0D8F5C|nr:vanadium-dependent haloperoxidase [Sphingosinicella terrae]
MRRAIGLLAATVALIAARPAAADSVTDWMEVANRYYLAGQAARGPRSPETERASSRVALAMFEAVNAIDRRYQSYLGLAPADAGASQDAAAVTAAYRVLLHHYPAQRTAIEESHALAMAAIPDDPARTGGIAVGEVAAAAALQAGGVDPAIAQRPYRPRTRPGEWVATALPSLEPYWATLRPWVASSTDSLQPPPPPPLASERWARDYEEVRRLGGRDSRERSAHQTLVARYRQAGDVMPALRQVSDMPGRTRVRNARMFALYQMAFDDAVQAMVVAKLHHDFWRPITAIRNGAEDGNDATPADAEWLPLLATPNFPEYPCGHCTVAGTVAELMTAETGVSPPGGVRIASQLSPDAAVQTFPSWNAWAQEVSDSRIYGGVHYRFSNEAGEQIGRRAARMALERALRPLPPAR